MIWVFSPQRSHRRNLICLTQDRRERCRHATMLLHLFCNVQATSYPKFLISSHRQSLDCKKTGFGRKDLAKYVFKGNKGTTSYILVFVRASLHSAFCSGQWSILKAYVEDTNHGKAKLMPSCRVQDKHFAVQSLPYIKVRTSTSTTMFDAAGMERSASSPVLAGTAEHTTT